MIHRLTALLLTLALLAAACGDDSTESTDDTSATTTINEAPQDDPPDDEPDEPDETTTTEPEELTASDTGVTESAVRIGVLFPDTAVINRDPGDLEAKFQVMVDTVNDAGGLNGRMLEMHFFALNPIDDTPWDAACVDLVENREVFAVLGLFPRQTADCYGQLNDTIVVSTFPITAEQLSNYTATAITIDAIPARLIDVRIAALIEGGVLAEGMKVAAVGGEADQDTHDQYIAALQAAGVEVVADTIILGDGNDMVALTTEMQRFTEVWKSSGAEAVLATADIVSQAVLIGYNNSDIDLPMLLPQGTGVAPSLLRDNQGLDLAPFELAVALVGGADQATKYANDEDGVRACVDRFQDATGEDVALDESRNNLGPTIVACQVFDIFAPVAAAAGVDLTTESFRTAAEAFGAIDVTDIGEASLGPDKFDLSDSAGVVAEFNADTAQFEPVG